MNNMTAYGKDFSFIRKLAQNIKIIVSPDNQEPAVSFLLGNGIDENRIICPYKKVEKNIRILGEDYNPQEYLDQIDRHRELPESDMLEVIVFSILYNTPGWMLCRAIESILKNRVRTLSRIGFGLTKEDFMQYG